jgi:hypothetical protein
MQKVREKGNTRGRLKKLQKKCVVHHRSSRLMYSEAIGRWMKTADMGDDTRSKVLHDLFIASPRVLPWAPKSAATDMEEHSPWT